MFTNILPEHASHVLVMSSTSSSALQMFSECFAFSDGLRGSKLPAQMLSSDSQMMYLSGNTTTTNSEY